MSSMACSRRDGGPLLPPDDPWASYARTEIRIRRARREVLVVRGAPAGEVASWPWPRTERIHVMSAWDPGGERPGAGANRRRQAELELELRSPARATPVSIWPVSGFDPESGYRDEGVAVSGMSDSDACALAARFGQDAIFSWSAGEWAIVASSAERRIAFGWTVEVLGPP
jgi:Protein of unknown function (DUF3293)